MNPKNAHIRRRRRQLGRTNSDAESILDRPLQAFDPLCRLWSLRTLVELGGMKELSCGEMFKAPHLLEYVGLHTRTAFDDDLFAEFDPDEIKARARQLLKAALIDPAQPPESEALCANLRWLQDELALSDLQRRILMLCVLERRNIHLSAALEALGELSAMRLYTVIATLLAAPVEDVAHALDPSGALARAGLARVDDRAFYNFQAKIDLLAGVEEHLLLNHGDHFGMFADNFVAGEPPGLRLEQFIYLEPRLGHMRTYFEQVIKSREAGSNVLVFGSPGTGKTQLARLLASMLKVQLFEVSVASGRGQRLPGHQRLAAYELSQKILGQRGNCIILFDEIEDIEEAAGQDDDEFLGPRRRANPRKGWFNTLLETNPVPAIWISNRISHIDPAHLRRFDMHLHMDTPPAQVRADMLAEQTRELGTSSEWCRRMAANTRLAPAVISRAARVVGKICAGGSSTAPESLLEEVIGASLSAQRITQAVLPKPAQSLGYQLSTVQASVDLAELLGGLRANPAARLCFYGPPGTGKSAFAQHLAAELGMPAMLQRASDILSAFVGETEQQMAGMFRRARDEGAVLILDEADSFLAERQGARQRWEVSAVNEMLTQMETFEGLFVATTNLIDRLDEASLRRFDAKICFDYLRPAQVAALMRQACASLGLDAAGCEDAASSLSKLTPGDFAAVLRQARFRPVRNAAELGQRLADEVSHKRGGGSGRTMGFRLQT
jgi:SpoVK/Ycf46/Vps4 family AAA+-type ATPase